MDETTIWTRLTDVFRDTFDDDALTIDRNTTAADVADWDSLRHIQLLVAVEKAFGVRFNTAEVAHLANVGEMVDLISRRLAEKPGR
jgi:acyl carrier protein